MNLPIQNTHLVKGIDPVADVFDSTVYSDVVSMKNWLYITFLIHIGVGATGTQTFTVEACDDAVPSNVSPVPFHYRQTLSGDTPGALTAAASTGFTCTAGSSKIIEICVPAQAGAASGYGYMRLKSVEVVNSPVLGGVTIVQSGPRYATEPALTTIV